MSDYSVKFHLPKLEPNIVTKKMYARTFGFVWIRFLM